MSLAAIHAETTAKVMQCKLGRVRDSLDDEDRAWLDDTLAGGERASVIATVLTRGGYPVGEQLVRNHRSGACCCVTR